MSTSTKVPKTANEWADYWYYSIGVNVIPAIPRVKGTGQSPAKVNWQEYEKKEVDKETFEKWKEQGLFEDGMAIFSGKIWRGEYKDKVLTAFDYDNLRAIEDACTDDDGVTHSLGELAQITIVEQHKDNRNKAHVYFVTDGPIADQSNLVKVYGKQYTANAYPAIEIKSATAKLMFCTPSVHKDGHRYEIIGALKPCVLNAIQTLELQAKYSKIFAKYAIKYEQDTDANNESLCKKSNLWNKNTAVNQGGRSVSLLSIGLSARYLFDGYLDEDIQRKLFEELNITLCNPPLDAAKVSIQWESVKSGVVKFARNSGKTLEREDIFKLATEDPNEIILGLKEIAENTKYVNPDSRLTHDKVKELARLQYEKLGGKDFESAWNNATTKPESRFIESLAPYSKDVKNEFRKHIGIKVSEYPTWVIAHQTDQQVKEAMLKKERNEEEEVIVQKPAWGLVLVDAIPSKIVETNNPLTNTLKYEMELVNSRKEKTVVESAPLQDVCKEILKTSLAWKPRLLNETIAAVINAYKDAGLVISKREIEEEGFFFIEDKLVASKIEVRQLTEEQAKQAISLIQDMQAKFYNRPIDQKRFAHILKLAVQAPFDYARRQKNYVHEAGTIPRPDLGGRPNTGKTYGWGTLFLTMYRKKPMEPYLVGQGSVNNETRFMLQTSKTTLPVICDEVDFLTDYKDEAVNRVLSLIKNQASMTHPRVIGTKEGKEDRKPSFSYPVFTHNSGLINEDGAAKRFSGIEFTESDIKAKADQDKFNEYMRANANTFGYIGDFATSYIMNKPDTLKKDWLNIGKEILSELFKLAGVEYPNWLDQIVENTSIEDVSENRRMRIRAILIDEINRVWAINRQELIARDERGMIIADYPLKERVRLLTERDLLGFAKVHHEKGICLTYSAVDLLKQKGLDRISMPQLADLTGFKCGEVWFGKSTKAVYQTLDGFADFLSLSQQSQTTLQNTDLKTSTALSSS